MKMISRFFAILLLSFAVFSTAQAQDSAKDFPLLANLGIGDPVPLLEAESPELEATLMEQLRKNPQWRSLITQRRLAVGVVDMSDPNNVKYAGINDQHMLYAASLPKIAVLLAAEDAINEGELVETDAVRQDMRLMIAKSNNAATTRMIDRVGFEKIEAVLTDERYKLYDPELGGGLWVGKRYAAGGRRYPEPMKGLSHAATTLQVARFYYLMANRMLVSPERSRDMIEIMRKPLLFHKFMKPLTQMTPNADVARKSGSWSTFHSDSVWVQDDNGRNYILVALVDHPQGGQIVPKLLPAVEKAMKAAR